MIILHCTEWLGPGRGAPLSSRVIEKRKHTSFRYIGKIVEALFALRRYEEAYEKKFGPALVVKFTLISITRFDDEEPTPLLCDQLMDHFNCFDLEEMLEELIKESKNENRTTSEA